jgi:Sensors of blue-light using FAD
MLPTAPGATTDLFQIVYVSSAVVLMSLDGVTSLLAWSRRENTRIGVTGLLLYHDGNFMQLLEGPEPVVRGLYARIEKDLRHRGCQTLLQTRIKERTFPQWSMGFRNLSSPEVRAMPGYSEFLNRCAPGEMLPLDSNLALRLLRMFRDNLR